VVKDLLQAIIRGEVEPPPVSRLLGLRAISGGDGRAVFDLDALPEHANPMGTVQGGIICALADAALGFAFATTLDDGESFTTVDLNTKYLRPIREGTMTASARVINRGRTLGLLECDVTDSEGRLLAHVTSTCMVLRR
jgi:uncharacterized protein (TIGR00369 family)